MDLNALKEFSTIAAEGSFAAAARKLNMPKSTISKHVQDLEAALGVRLMERTTRRLSLTQEGEMLLARAERILSDAEEISEALGDRLEDARGHLRLAAPVVFGQAFMGQIVAVCRRLYPDLTFEIVLTDSLPDLVEEGFDGAIRLGELPDSPFAQQKVAATHRVPVCAPGMLDAPLKVPGDLAGLPVLLRGTGLIQTWHLTDGNREHAVRMAGGVAMTSDIALRDAALGGAGIALLPLYLVEADLASGRLVTPLNGWKTAPIDVVFVYPGAHALTRRLRACLDVLLGAFPGGTLHGGLLRGAQ